VSKVEDSNFCPLRRIRHPFNQQKVTQGALPPQKDVKNEGRSGYMYENKRRLTKCQPKCRAFCAQLTPLLRKIAGFEGQFTAFFDFGALPCRYLRRQAASPRLRLGAWPHPAVGDLSAGPSRVPIALEDAMLGWVSGPLAEAQCRLTVASTPSAPIFLVTTIPGVQCSSVSDSKSGDTSAD
jgi:hypothetical protein